MGLYSYCVQRQIFPVVLIGPLRRGGAGKWNCQCQRKFHLLTLLVCCVWFSVTNMHLLILLCSFLDPPSCSEAFLAQLDIHGFHSDIDHIVYPKFDVSLQSGT